MYGGGTENSYSTTSPKYEKIGLEKNETFTIFQPSKRNNSY